MSLNFFYMYHSSVAQYEYEYDGLDMEDLLDT